MNFQFVQCVIQFHLASVVQGRRLTLHSEGHQHGRIGTMATNNDFFGHRSAVLLVSFRPDASAQSAIRLRVFVKRGLVYYRAEAQSSYVAG